MNLCIYCAGGFGKEVYDIALRINKVEPRWSKSFFTDDSKEDGSDYYNANLFSIDNIINNMDCANIEFVIANGEPFVKEKIYKALINNN